MFKRNFILWPLHQYKHLRSAAKGLSLLKAAMVIAVRGDKDDKVSVICTEKIPNNAVSLMLLLVVSPFAVNYWGNCELYIAFLILYYWT